MTPKERGERAAALLSDEVFEAAFTGLREKMVRQLEDTAFGDSETHHQVAISLQLLQRLRLTLRQFIDQGEAEQLLQENARKMHNLRQSISKP